MANYKIIARAMRTEKINMRLRQTGMKTPKHDLENNDPIYE